MNTSINSINSSSPMAISSAPRQRPIYSPGALLQLAPGISPFSSSSASSSSSAASSSWSSSRVSSNPSPSSASFMLSQLQNFPDILAPSAAAAAAATANHTAAATSSETKAKAHIATDGNGRLPSGTITSLFDTWDIYADEGDDDEEEEEFVYGESSFGREDLEEEEVERVRRALKAALFGGRGGGRGRMNAVVWQAQTPRTKTPSRAASPVREFASPLVPTQTANDDNNNSATLTITTTTTTMTRPVIVRTNSFQQGPPSSMVLSRPSALNRSRSRSGTVMSRECAASAAASMSSSSSSVWRSRRLVAAQQQQQQQSQSQLEWRRGQPVRGAAGARGVAYMVDAKRNGGVGAGVGAGKEAEVTSWRKMEGGSEWRWNEPLGSYVVVKV